MAALNEAITSENAARVSELAEIAIRAYAAMDAAATAAGHAPATPDQWIAEIEGRKYLVVREAHEWRELPGHKTVTLRELLVTFERLPSAAMAARDAFPGATVAAINPPRERTQIERDLEDEIPF